MMKISPNDRCACGSGKKYKRCCMAGDEAAARAAKAGPVPAHSAGTRDSASESEAILRATFGGKTFRETAGRAVEHLARLMERGRALEFFRFDATLFANAVTRGLAELEGRGVDVSSEDGFEALFEHCLGALATPAFLESSLATLESVPARSERTEDAVAIALAAASLAAHRQGGFEELSQSPVLRTVYDVQLQELLNDRRELGGRLHGLRPLGRAGSPLPEKAEAAAEPFEASPELQRAIRQENGAAMAAALEALRSGKVPSFLTTDEYLWMVAQVVEVFDEAPSTGTASLRTGEARASALQTLNARFAASGLGLNVTGRLMAMLQKAPEGQGKVLKDLLVAFSTQPGLVMIEAARARLEPLVRTGEAETLAACLGTDWSSESAFEAHLQALESMGEKDAAERLRAVRPWLLRSDKAAAEVER